MALSDHSDFSPADNADNDTGYDAPGSTVAADVEAHGCESAADSRRASRDKVGEVCLCDWIARVVRKDQQSLAEIYETMAGRVYGLALRITRQVQTAEEVTEDCFWQVWRHAPRFVPTRGAAMAWIMTIARRRARRPASLEHRGTTRR